VYNVVEKHLLAKNIYQYPVDDQDFLIAWRKTEPSESPRKLEIDIFDAFYKKYEKRLIAYLDNQ